MIRHIWSVLCKESIIDEGSKNISLLNVLEQLQATLKPSPKIQGRSKKINVPINYEIVSLWTKPNTLKKEEASIEYRLLSPEGKIVNKNERKIAIPANLKRLRTRVKVKGLTILENGEYLFKIGLKEKGHKSFRTVARLPLQVEVNVKKFSKKN